MTWAWGLLAAVALLWPDRVAGPFDGVPLDGVAEALVVAVLFPALWWFDPRFLAARASRAAILVLLASRLASALALGQEGWCVRFEPSRPYVFEQTGAPHAWDLRADWRSPNPACSAIMTRPYRTFADFPAWFFNLPPDNDSWPGPLDRPPGATTRMTVAGYLFVRASGTLRIDRSDDVRATVSVDGGADSPASTLDAGIHHVAIAATLTGERWRLVPTWNAVELWHPTDAGALATVRRPTTVDRLLGPAERWLTTGLVVMFVAAWFVSAFRRVRDVVILGWSMAAAGTLVLLVAADHPAAARVVIASLALSAMLPIRDAFRNQRGLFLLVGVPWLAYVGASAAPAVGHFVLYDWGHDYWMFQRFAYRIAMQGHWLEGGSATFWFQPFYRWIVAALHMIFGDSSAGEWFWDAACLLAGSMFSYRLVRERASHRWSVCAAVLPLAIFVLGTPQYLIGRGLGEISSMGLLSAAGLLAMRSRHGSLRFAAAAGALTTVAFYTRLNNLPIAAGVAALSLNPRRLARSRWRAPAAILGVVAAGLAAFTWRNWYFTGRFSLFYGTQKDLLATWQPGMSIGAALQRAAESVLMVLTVNDPPRFDVFAVPVLFGALVGLLAALRTPGFRDVPASACAFFLSAISGAIVARGSAYPGRFSLHILPITCALAVMTVARVATTLTTAWHVRTPSPTRSSVERSTGST